MYDLYSLSSYSSFRIATVWSRVTLSLNYLNSISISRLQRANVRSTLSYTTSNLLFRTRSSSFCFPGFISFYMSAANASSSMASSPSSPSNSLGFPPSARLCSPRSPPSVGRRPRRADSERPGASSLIWFFSSSLSAALPPRAPSACWTAFCFLYFASSLTARNKKSAAPRFACTPSQLG